METELARTVDLMMARAKEKSEKLKKAVETLACGSCSYSISRSPKLLLVFLLLDRDTVHVFYFLNT